MIPKAHEGDRGVVVELLSGIEGSCRNTRELLIDERCTRSIASTPIMATPQNPNPPTQAAMLHAADQTFGAALAQLDRVLMLAANLHAIRHPAPAAERPKEPAAGRMNGLHLAD